MIAVNRTSGVQLDVQMVGRRLLMNFVNGVLFAPGTGFVHRTKAGAFDDTDFTNPVDGMTGLDTSNHRLYVRSGGVWRFTQLA